MAHYGDEINVVKGLKKLILFAQNALDGCKEECDTDDYIIVENGQPIRSHGIALWAISSGEYKNRTDL